MNIFAISSYKEVIRDAVLERKALQGGVQFSFQGVARACKLQKTYFSRVLNGDAHLNPDQLQMVMDHLGFSDEEQDYVSLLHAYERATYKTLRRRLERRIEASRARNLRTDKVLKDAEIRGLADTAMSYFLQPNLQILHLMLTIPRFAQDLNLTRNSLGLSSELFDVMLRELESLGFIERSRTQANVLRDNLHLSFDSPCIKPYHTMMRMKAVEGITNSSSGNPYAYSLFFSANEEARAKLQDAFFTFLKRAQSLIQAAPSERVYQMGFDLLSW